MSHRLVRDGAACDLDLREDSEIVTNNELDAVSYSIELSIVTSTRYFDRININSYHCVRRRWRRNTRTPSWSGYLVHR